MNRAVCLSRDESDRLGPLREGFDLPSGIIYFDGNSLGALPKATAARLQRLIVEEWGRDLIGSWNGAGWIDLPRRVGEKIARLVGAGPGELVVADSTSVNLFKVLAGALEIAKEDAPQRRVIVSERDNFPTDLYIAQSLARQHGFELKLVSTADLGAALQAGPALLLLTQVNYRTGALHDMAALTSAAHQVGALVVWDLAHSAGALPVDLKGSDADFAVGCGYKYLNGGPGAPAFVWVNPRHTERFWQPLAGWMGHEAPFQFRAEYRPAAGITRFLCGTPAILSMAALECGVDSVLAAEAVGGIRALREKSLALSDLFIELLGARCAGLGLEVVTPRGHAQRGSQVSLSCAAGAFAIVQALIERGVVGDFRAGHAQAGQPDILRFGFAPLYVRFVDVWDAVEQLRQVLMSEQWREPRFNQRAAVT